MACIADARPTSCQAALHDKRWSSLAFVAQRALQSDAEASSGSSSIAKPVATQRSGEHRWPLKGKTSRSNSLSQASTCADEESSRSSSRPSIASSRSSSGWASRRSVDADALDRDLAKQRRSLASWIKDGLQQVEDNQQRMPGHCLPIRVRRGQLPAEVGDTAWSLVFDFGGHQAPQDGRQEAIRSVARELLRSPARSPDASMWNEHLEELIASPTRLPPICARTPRPRRHAWAN